MTQPLRRLITGALGLTAIGVLGAVALVNAQDKEAQGSVTAVSDSSMTISSGARSMTFVVADDTKLEVKAAARQTRQARDASTPGVKLTQYVKIGNPVLVRYKEAGGQLLALSVRPVSSAGDGSAPSEPVNKVANGTVKAVSLSQVTLDSNGKDLTFAINSDTNVIARGATKATKAAGGKTTIADFVHNGDSVSITYLEQAGTMTASEVRVRAAKK
jgi:Domain of unknown function (DUF5666)